MDGRRGGIPGVISEPKDARRAGPCSWSSAWSWARCCSWRFGPDITTRLMIIVLSAFVIVDGLATLFEAAGVASQRGAWALLVLKALIGFAAGVAIVLRPGSRAVTTLHGGHC